MRRLTTFGLALSLLAAGCSNESGSTAAAVASAEVTARVEESMGTGAVVDPGATEVLEGCRIEIVEDEYGFETEIVVCDDEPASTTSSIPATDLASWLESRDARAVANALYSIVILQDGCNGTETIAQLEALAGAAPEAVAGPLEAAVADLYRMAAACKADDAEWQRALEDALDDLDTLAAILRGAPNA
ncbi:MAG: hypothetical protein KJ698_04065 [Actinobacteria bacterium]|nr:hypothetical protein [Actinomycetota bacterium]MBU1494161.1 hypothetical protein [Actinomycetota bacterium]